MARIRHAAFVTGMRFVGAVEWLPRGERGILDWSTSPSDKGGEAALSFQDAARETKPGDGRA